MSITLGKDLKSVITYSFTRREEKILPGTCTVDKDLEGCNVPMNISTDTIGNLGIKIADNGRFCWSNYFANHAEYRNTNYRVEKGVCNSSSGQHHLDAYTIYPAAIKATRRTAAKQFICYNFPVRQHYTVYILANGALEKIWEISEELVTENGFTDITDLAVQNLKEPTTYVFIPTDEDISEFPRLGDGVYGALLAKSAVGSVSVYRYDVTPTPSDTALDFPYGPGTWNNRYAPDRKFFPIKLSTGQIGIVWQDQNSLIIYLTTLGSDFKSKTTTTLNLGISNAFLAAVTNDPDGNIYILTVQTGEGLARETWLFKTTESGTVTTRRQQDSSKTGLNIWMYFGPSSMSYLDGKLGTIISRKMHVSDVDGLKHQGAIAVVFDAANLTLTRNHGQTSGHSFGNSLIISESIRKFIGIDLGDNYPRGINLHRFDENRIDSRVVYTFKTKHGDVPANPAKKVFPEYYEISSADKTYYTWSNDNNTYSELGAVIECDDGYLVVFIGEPTSNGKALLNNRTGQLLNDPRDIGLVRVREDFTTTSRTEQNVVTQDIMLTTGIQEDGPLCGFYDFSGKWKPQANAGVVWQVNYEDKTTQNASRLKAAKLSNGDILLLWEKWAPDEYLGTYAKIITKDGIDKYPTTNLGAHVRLSRQDDVLVVDNKVYFVNGEKDERKLELYVFDLSKIFPPMLTKIAGNKNSWGNSENGKSVRNTAILMDCPMAFSNNSSLYYTTDLLPYGFTLNKIDKSGIFNEVFAIHSSNEMPDGSSNLIEINNEDNLYFCFLQGYSIYKNNLNTLMKTRIAGTGERGSSGDGGPAVEAQFGYITDMVIDNGGNLYIADYEFCRIRKIDTSGNISTFAGNGNSATGETANFSDNTISPDGTIATEAIIGNPNSLAIAEDGTLYAMVEFDLRTPFVNDEGTTINKGKQFIKIGPDGRIQKIPAATDNWERQGYMQIESIAVGNNGKIYIPNSVLNKIITVDVNSGEQGTLVGTGQPEHKDGPLDIAQVSKPNAVKFDKMGNLYIVEQCGNDACGYSKIISKINGLS